jgi:hypothetical protein
MSNEEPQIQGKGKKREAIKQSFRQGMQSIGAGWARFRGKSKSPSATRSSTPQHAELLPASSAGPSQGGGRLLDVPNRYLDFLEPSVHGMSTIPHSMLHGIAGAHWVEGPDHSIQHGPKPQSLDVELVEERESLVEDLPRLAIPQAPNRESFRLSLIIQKQTMDAVTAPKKAVSSSSYRGRGLFNYIVNRCHSQRLA